MHTARPFATSYFNTGRIFSTSVWGLGITCVATNSPSRDALVEPASTAAFTAPKQKLQYKITVSNSGTYNAKLTAASIPTLETITVTGTGEAAETDAANVKKHLKFSFTKADGGAVTPETDTLAAGTTQDYLYTIEYEDLTNAAELPKAQVSISIPQTTLTFSQAN